MTAPLEVRGLSVAYGPRTVLTGIDLSIGAGTLTVLVGRNGCGKSTLLRAAARVVRPSAGRVLLQGRDVACEDTRWVAQRMSFLPQGPGAPAGLTVEELVAFGRFPRRRWFGAAGKEDREAVERALARLALGELRGKPLELLSGGERQRAWLAMALAQETEVLLLDEPTSHLDWCHQLELLDLLRRLVREDGRAALLVMHDLPLACRCADVLAVLQEGRLAAVGAPAEVVDSALLHSAFGVEAEVRADPATGRPWPVPRAGR